MSPVPAPLQEARLDAQVRVWVAATPPASPRQADLLWAVAPTLWECLGGPSSRPSPVYERVRDRALRAVPRAPSFHVGEGAVAIANTANQRRSVLPVLAARGGDPRAVSLPRGPLMRDRSAPDLLRALVDRAVDAGLPLDHAQLTRRVLKADRVLDRARTLLADADVLLVSNQHLADHRAALRCARRLGVPSVYVPHAPLADNPSYRDLPVDHAGLRGVEEARWYEGWGADPDRLTVVGNPAVEDADPPPTCDGPPLFALSPWPAEELRLAIDAVARAVEGPVVVALHPRMRRRVLRRSVPSSWTFWDGRTWDALRAGPGVVVQMSSGVAWEALLHGLPTVDLTVDGQPPSYPLIDPAYVPAAHDAATLRTAIATARGMADDAGRARLREWARRWCSVWGEEAARRGADLIDRARRQGPAPTPVLDSWASGPA